MFTTWLSSDAQNVLAILSQPGVCPDGTYMAGGSALALQLGHRKSYDNELGIVVFGPAQSEKVPTRWE